MILLLAPPAACRCPGGESSSARGVHLQVLALHGGMTFGGLVGVSPQPLQVSVQCRLLVLVKRSKRPVGGAVVSAKEVHHFARRKGVTEGVHATCQGQGAHPLAQWLLDRGLVAPQQR